MLRLLFVLCFCSTEILLAEDDARAILMKIRDKVVADISQSNKYICVEDLTRRYYVAANPKEACQQPPELPLTPARLQDRLKLDIAVSEGTEIYSWHGENKFTGGSIGQLVRQGPIASGSFNGYLRNIFGEHGVSFTYRGMASTGGNNFYHFDYEVPLAASHYQIGTGSGLAIIPFHGSLAARAGTFELASLAVTADGDKIPKQVNICAVRTDLTYQTVQIAGRMALLPSSFDLKTGTRNLTFTQSKGSYTECHEYRGESTVHFDSTDPTADVSGPTITETATLPLRLELQIALRTPIDEDTAYAGQPVEAVLVRNTKVAKGRLLQRGATLRGVITQLQIYHSPYHYVALGMEFSSLTDGKTQYLCKAIHSASLGLPAPWNTAPSRAQMERGSGVMIFNTPHLKLDASFTSLFVTVNQGNVDPDVDPAGEEARE